MTDTAIFAAGCFWGVKAAFREVPGVLEVESGCTGGATYRAEEYHQRYFQKNPSAVCHI